MAKAKAKVTGAAGGKYKRTRVLTLPTLKLADEVAVHVTATDKMHISTAQQKAGSDGKVMEPATVLPVTDLDTGEVTQIILGAVLKGILEETYPKDSYVGRSFEITKHAKATGKRYNTYSVFEIDAG